MTTNGFAEGDNVRAACELLHGVVPSMTPGRVTEIYDPSSEMVARGYCMEVQFDLTEANIPVPSTNVGRYFITVSTNVRYSEVEKV